jgi:hypothetical protein
MNKIDNLALALLIMLRQEVMSQIEEKGDQDLNIFEKELEIKETINAAIRLAKSSLNGDVTIAILKSPGHNKKDTAIDLIKKSRVRISFFNTTDLDGHLTKTIIFIPNNWSTKFRVFQCSINLTDDYLKED